MPRGLNNWEAGSVIKFLKKNGFTHTHTNGSHFYYSRKTGSKSYVVTVPVHTKRPIHPKVMKSIIDQSGISKDEWLN